MPRDGSGTYNLPSGQPVVTSTPISSTVHNTLATDVASALTQSLSKDGQTTPTADLPMGGNKHTGVADATARSHYAAAGQVQDGVFTKAGSVSGTDTIIASLTPALPAYVEGMAVVFEPAANNTGAVTLALNGLTAKAVKRPYGAALLPRDLVSGVPALIVYDGTDFLLINPQNTGVGQNAQASSYTCVLSDANKHIIKTTGSGDTYTIPANASVAYPLGTCLTFVNTSGANLTIAITSDTLTLAGTSSTGSRALSGTNGIATAVKLATTSWLISGTGIA
jgi:hypothetical protein